jgi:peptidoglycan hydrolase CwlO-like protein
MRNIHAHCREIEDAMEELQAELEELYEDGYTDDDDEVKEVKQAIESCENGIDNLCERYVEMQNGGD